MKEKAQERGTKRNVLYDPFISRSQLNFNRVNQNIRLSVSSQFLGEISRDSGKLKYCFEFVCNEGVSFRES